MFLQTLENRRKKFLLILTVRHLLFYFLNRRSASLIFPHPSDSFQNLILKYMKNLQNYLFILQYIYFGIYQKTIKHKLYFFFHTA